MKTSLMFDPDRPEHDIEIIERERALEFLDCIELEGRSLAAEGHEIFTWLSETGKDEREEALQAAIGFVARFGRWARKYEGGR
jgi:hypothetical protein